MAKITWDGTRVIDVQTVPIKHTHRMRLDTVVLPVGLGDGWDAA
ncbi:hypothetical protein SAMN05216345_11731 [Cupriavidus sp. YR651]|nr:hypothetical protein SAMN05216345_11731 [Cupriavidus sp. YR651]